MLRFPMVSLGPTLCNGVWENNGKPNSLEGKKKSKTLFSHLLAPGLRDFSDLPFLLVRHPPPPLVTGSRPDKSSLGKTVNHIHRFSSINDPPTLVAIILNEIEILISDCWLPSASNFRAVRWISTHSRGRFGPDFFFEPDRLCSAAPWPRGF